MAYPFTFRSKSHICKIKKMTACISLAVKSGEKQKHFRTYLIIKGIRGKNIRRNEKMTALKILSVKGAKNNKNRPWPFPHSDNQIKWGYPMQKRNSVQREHCKAATQRWFFDIFAKTTAEIHFFVIYSCHLLRFFSDRVVFS